MISCIKLHRSFPFQMYFKIKLSCSISDQWPSQSLPTQHYWQEPQSDYMRKVLWTNTTKFEGSVCWQEMGVCLEKLKLGRQVTWKIVELLCQKWEDREIVKATDTECGISCVQSRCTTTELWPSLAFAYALCFLGLTLRKVCIGCQLHCLWPTF